MLFVLIFTAGTLVLLLYYEPSVQTLAAKKAARWLSGQLHTRVEIGSLKISGLSTFDLEHLYVQDQQGDTLILIPKLSINLLSYHELDLDKNQLNVQDLRIQGGEFFLHTVRNGKLNLDFLIDYFSGSPSAPGGKPFTLQVRNIHITNFHFKMENEKLEKKLPAGIFNVNDIDINKANVEAKDFYLQDDSIHANVSHVTLHEKSGFIVNHLQTYFYIGLHQMQFTRLLIKTPTSSIGDLYEMHFRHIASFDTFEHDVYLKAHLAHTHITSKDISYFDSELRSFNLQADISASGKGNLDNLKIRGLVFHTAKGTDIRGNVSLKGLPDVESTFMELNLSQFATSTDDLKQLMNETGLSRSISQIPRELLALGKVNYTGRFDGFYNDFVARGNLSTSIGNLVTDINFKFKNSRLPVYSGTLSTGEFDLGRLLHEPTLNKIGLTAQIRGSGFSQLASSDTIDTHLNFVDFKGYRYQQINVRGSRKRKLFNGEITVNDPNLGLAFRGSVDLNGALPAYNFKAAIGHADLRKLEYIKDSIELQTQLDIKATGSDVNNLEGKILITRTNLQRNGITHRIDSISILAAKTAGLRTLNLHSCLMDANVTGQYDLATFPSAVKRIFAGYIPSITGLNIVNSKSQNFNFNLNIYDAEPLLSIFAPDIKLTGTAEAQGKFNALNGQFSTSGNLNELSVGPLEFTGVSFEGENEQRQSINLNISVDSVQTSHKALAKNVYIYNNIRNDSLLFNLKISDVNAINHLDLNGQLGFAGKTTNLGILPSVLVLDRQSWEVGTGFNVKFQHGITQVQDFNIHHNNESLEINGPLSANKGDTVTAVFKNFNIAAANQILNEYNLQLNGNLNGRALLSSVTNHLSFQSDLGIDSLAINKIYVGTMALVNSWDGLEKTIGFTGKIHRKLINVLDLKGILGFSEPGGSIDASLQLNKAEAVILQPLVGDLLSDLKGTLSSDLQISGSTSNPIIDGNIKLENTEFTINYLKTHFKVNDEVKFENGYIHINNLRLTDPFYVPSRPQLHSAYATGDIDLSQLSHPYFDAVLHASDFLCLNTGEKDNDQYFGTAFATGKFSFVGPLETMNIDITASTNKNTTFNIPLNRPGTVGTHDYITFVTQRDSINSVRRHKNLHTGVTLNFNMNITPDAIVKLEFDNSIGDVIRGAGSSDMNLQITPQGEFLMFGTYEIDHGDYLFTSENVLNKLFTVERGGSIRFTGEPLNAQLNLHANYQARTSIKNLYDAANVQPTNASALDQSVLVACRINLEGNLSRPTFDFDLLFPNDPNIEYDLQTYLSSNEVVTTQSMLFLVSNQFNGKLTPGNGAAIVTSTAVQYVSSQLSHLLNNFSNRLDLNFRSLSDVGFNYHVANDRLLFTGNIASTDTANGIGYNPLALTRKKFIAGNVEIAYLLNRARNLTLRTFYKPIPQDIRLPGTALNTLYSPGLGLVYQKDFSSLRSIFRKKPKPVSVLPALSPGVKQGIPTPPSRVVKTAADSIRMNDRKN